MSQPIPIAVIGLGRMGALHAFHAAELESQKGLCTLAAVVDADAARAEQTAGRLSQTSGNPVRAFRRVEELVESRLCRAAVIASPTSLHREHAQALIEAGCRVLLEKPLTGSLEGDREFAGWLSERHPNALMLAFQRRFDPALRKARQLIEQGAIGRVFKIVSVLEDSNPLPDGYVSLGILSDMSVHNVDEVLWLTGRLPVAAASIGNRLFSYRRTSAQEDFDDALLYLWFEGELAAQIQVSRNHVSGYRVETWIFGEAGQIHAGRFEQDRFAVMLEAYGRSEPLLKEVFPTRDYGRMMPEFADRFGPAYQAELEEFLLRCRNDEPFTVTHADGLRAMEVIAAGQQFSIRPEQGAKVEASGRGLAVSLPGRAEAHG